MIKEIAKILTTGGSHKAKPVVLKELENGCIVCVSHRLTSKGYLQLVREGKHVRANRLVYEHFYGSIPEGLLVCHDCDHPPCLNPQHFFAGTKADNNRDKAEKGREARGEKNGSAKLSTEKVLAIREKYRTGEYTQTELGREYGVHRAQIGFIVNDKQWRHLTP